MWLSGNIPKLLLALESVVFDLLFMVQHYVLYTNRADPVAAHSGDTEDGEEGGKAGQQGDAYEALHSPINVNGKGASDDEKANGDSGY